MGITHLMFKKYSVFVVFLSLLSACGGDEDNTTGSEQSASVTENETSSRYQVSNVKMEQYPVSFSFKIPYSEEKAYFEIFVSTREDEIITSKSLAVLKCESGTCKVKSTNSEIGDNYSLSTSTVNSEMTVTFAPSGYESVSGGEEGWAMVQGQNKSGDIKFEAASSHVSL